MASTTPIPYCPSCSSGFTSPSRSATSSPTHAPPAPGIGFDWKWNIDIGDWFKCSTVRLIESSIEPTTVHPFVMPFTPSSSPVDLSRHDATIMVMDRLRVNRKKNVKRQMIIND